MNQDDVVEAEVVQRALPTRLPVRGREFLAVIAAIVLADVTIYRGHGYAGYAALLAAAPLLLRWGAPPLTAAKGTRNLLGQLIVGGLMLALAGKMLWCGWALHIVLGIALLFAFALSVRGAVPDMFEILVFPVRMMLGNLLGFIAYCQSVPRYGLRTRPIRWLNIGLPFITFLAFSLLFILANPDLLDAFGRHAEKLLTRCRQAIIEFSPPSAEIAFWFAAAAVMIGLLRPLLTPSVIQELEDTQKEAETQDAAQSNSPFYTPARNTLMTVIALFAIYLTFEFKTLWFRDFPPGFYYSGYAHQGAAWLTVALALATVVLSLAFRGSILNDLRLRTLRRMAWLWSLENILLAIAVYHRLYIYVGFNGMTRMRIVGILGITAVLVGFLLVVWKIAFNRGFFWLVRRHLWTVALAVYLYGVLPVDSIVVQYNVRRILAGDPAPSVQITEQPINSAGALLLTPLLNCNDDIIREGVRAYLADRHEAAKTRHQQQRQEGWTAYQYTDQLLFQKLHAIDDQLARYQDTAERKQVFDAFRSYAYQWY